MNRALECINEPRVRGSYPGCEVNSCSSVQQERGHVDIAVVGSDVQGRESALEERRDGDRHGERSRGGQKLVPQVCETLTAVY